jgi:hypothetical protein
MCMCDELNLFIDYTNRYYCLGNCRGGAFAFYAAFSQENFIEQKRVLHTFNNMFFLQIEIFSKQIIQNFAQHRVS